jgi:ankyrin repeat protein
MYGNPESLKFLLANGAKTNISDAEGNTPLHIAAFYRNSENLETILEANPDLDTINSEGNTPLLLSVRQPDNEKTVALLLQAGADVNIADPAGRNALLVCVDSSQKEYVGPLVSMGIDIDSQDNDGNTALHYIFNKVLANKLYIPMCKEIARPLLEGGAHSSIRNKEGKSPADLAEESGEDELIDLLKSTARKKESR